MDECTIDADVLTEIAVFALALPTVEDYVIKELRPAIVAVSAAVAVRIFDKFHTVPVNTEDISIQLLNTIHAEVLATGAAGRPGAVALFTMVDVLVAEFALAAVAIAALSVVRLVLIDHTMAALAVDLELGKILLELLVKRLQFLLNFEALSGFMIEPESAWRVRECEHITFCFQHFHSAVVDTKAEVIQLIYALLRSIDVNELFKFD